MRFNVTVCGVNEYIELLWYSCRKSVWPTVLLSWLNGCFSWSSLRTLLSICECLLMFAVYYLPLELWGPFYLYLGLFGIALSGLFVRCFKFLNVIVITVAICAIRFLVILEPIFAIRLTKLADWLLVSKKIKVCSTWRISTFSFRWKWLNEGVLIHSWVDWGTWADLGQKQLKRFCWLISVC